MKKTTVSATSSPRSAIARHSLHDAITSHLRDMIIEGELEPGKRIVTIQVAADGMSPTT
ncbi:hypothetical protein [Salinicola sp. NYA28a]